LIDIHSIRKKTAIPKAIASLSFNAVSSSIFSIHGLSANQLPNFHGFLCDDIFFYDSLSDAVFWLIFLSRVIDREGVGVGEERERPCESLLVGFSSATFDIVGVKFSKVEESKSKGCIGETERDNFSDSIKNLYKLTKYNVSALDRLSSPNDIQAPLSVLLEKKLKTDIKFVPIATIKICLHLVQNHLSLSEGDNVFQGFNIVKFIRIFLQNLLVFYLDVRVHCSPLA